MTTRRAFIGGAAAGAAALPLGSWAAKSSSPNLTFGVIGAPESCRFENWADNLEKAFRYFKTKNVDAVVIAGDITKSGLIEEMERFSILWNKEFPSGGGKGAQKVELLAVTGDHDIIGWHGRWKDFTKEQLESRRFAYEDNTKTVWRRLFRKEWEPIWRKEIKGYTFIGVHWPCPKMPPIKDYLLKCEAELKGDKPFFLLSHMLPRNTYRGNVGNEEMAEVLRRFHNAVAFTGGTDHPSLLDEQCLWQGAFTSIRAGCINESLFGVEYENMAPSWHPAYKKHVMEPDKSIVSHGGGVELVQVYDDHLAIHRMHTEGGFKQTLGAPWTVSLPAKVGGDGELGGRKQRRRAPQFSAGARLDVTLCPNGHPSLGPSFKGKPCYCVTIPRAKTVKAARTGESCRVYDYVVTVSADGMEPIGRKIIASGASLPETLANVPSKCLFLASELPEKRALHFSVVPRDCFGLEGKPIAKTFSP